MGPTQPEARPSEPQVLHWYRVYCAVLLALYLIATPCLMWLSTQQRGPGFDMPPSGDAQIDSITRMFREDQERKSRDAAVMGIVLGLVFATPVGIALTLKPSPGAWIYHIVIMCLGLGGCTLPFSVLLLINWFRPETQAYFGRGEGAAHLSPDDRGNVG